MFLHRYIVTTFGVNKLGIFTERYDRLDKEEMACYVANTNPPNFLLSQKPEGPILSEKECEQYLLNMKYAEKFYKEKRNTWSKNSQDGK